MFWAVLLLSSLLFAQLDPSRVSEAEYSILEQRTVNSAAEQILNLSINVSLPIDGLILQSPASARTHKDAWGNPYLTIWEPKPIMPYTFLINSTVLIQSTPLRELPSSFKVGADLAPFLRSSPSVPSSDPTISQMALSITANSSDQFEAISRLARQVHDLIHYDSTMVDQRPNVSQILADPRGVCTEYSLLFVTLARSQGYPARFVGGYAYSVDTEGWQGHSWAEVWLGKWVSVDPTWLEVGMLDATHIPLTRTADPEVQTISISAMIVGTGDLDIGRETLGVPTDEVHLLRLVNQSDNSPLPLHSSSDKLPPGGQAILWTEYTSDHYGLVNTILSPCTAKTGEILTIRSQTQTFVTRPNQTYYLIWESQASADLDPDYEYRCPLSFGMDGYGPQSFPLTVSDRLSASWPVVSASLERSRLQVGEPMSVFVRAPRSLAGQPVHLLESALHLQANLDRNGQGVFNFTPIGIGTHTLYLFSSSGDPISLVYDVQSSPLPSLDLSGPASGAEALIPFNVTIQVHDLDPTLSPPRLHLAWSFDQASGELPLPSANDTVHLELKADSEGEPLLLVRLLDADGTEIARSVKPFSVNASSEISVSSIAEAAGRTLQKQTVPGSSSTPSSTSLMPSSEALANIYNFGAIPLMAVLAFVFIAVLALAIYRRIRSSDSSFDSSYEEPPPGQQPPGF